MRNLYSFWTAINNVTKLKYALSTLKSKLRLFPWSYSSGMTLLLRLGEYLFPISHSADEWYIIENYLELVLVTSLHSSIGTCLLDPYKINLDNACLIASSGHLLTIKTKSISWVISWTFHIFEWTKFGNLKYIIEFSCTRELEGYMGSLYPLVTSMHVVFGVCSLLVCRQRPMFCFTFRHQNIWIISLKGWNSRNQKICHQNYAFASDIINKAWKVGVKFFYPSILQYTLCWWAHTYLF